jgi:hypothetical protein
LVEELRAHVGAVTVDARAYPAQGPLPYGVATAWLRSQPVAARLARLDTLHLTELARLLPELAAQLPPPEPLAEAELHRRLVDGILRALLGAGAPLLLIVDDAQWADTQSLRIIFELLHVASSARLLVIATVRREEIDDDHPLIGLTADAQALGRVIEIPLGRLDRAETALLAQRIARTPLGTTELERLYAETEGNPLFLVEALKPDAPVATKVLAVIAGRLARLSPSARALARVAAAIGRAFTADVLAAAMRFTTSFDEQGFVPALDELWRRGIVRAHGPNAYDFSHGRIRDAAYASLSPPRRREAHLAVARALEQGGNAPPLALAQHFERAGAIADAVRCYARAAEAAQWLHAHHDAVRALERAVALSDDLPAGPATGELQLRLLTAMPAPLLACEGYASKRMEQVHARALALAHQLGTEPEPPLVWSLAMSALTRGAWGAAHEFGEQLCDRAERDKDPALWVESNYIRGIASYWPGRLVQARDYFEAAMRRFEPARRRAHVLRYGQDPELLVRLRLAHTLWLLGDPDQADRQRDLALMAAAESSHAYSRAVTWIWAAILAVERGDVTELRRHVSALERDAGEGAPAQVSLAALILAGYLEVLDAAPKPGLKRLRDARERVISGPPPAPGVPAVATYLLLKGYAWADEVVAGLKLADEAIGMGRGAELWEAEIRRMRASFLAAVHAPGRKIEDELWHALAVAQRQGARPFERRIRETLAERSVNQDLAS